MKDDNDECGRCGHRRLWHANFPSIGEGECQAPIGCDCFEFRSAVVVKPTEIPDDEPSVMGAGCSQSPLPTQVEAEAVWRVAYVARMVERGIHIDDARACCDAGDVNLSENPADAADDQLQYWENDGDSPVATPPPPKEPPVRSADD